MPCNALKIFQSKGYNTFDFENAETRRWVLWGRVFGNLAGTVQQKDNVVVAVSEKNHDNIVFTGPVLTSFATNLRLHEVTMQGTTTVALKKLKTEQQQEEFERETLILQYITFVGDSEGPKRMRISFDFTGYMKHRKGRDSLYWNT